VNGSPPAEITADGRVPAERRGHPTTFIDEPRAVRPHWSEARLVGSPYAHLDLPAPRRKRKDQNLPAAATSPGVQAATVRRAPQMTDHVQIPVAMPAPQPRHAVTGTGRRTNCDAFLAASSGELWNPRASSWER